MLTTCSDCPTIYIDADTVSTVGRLLADHSVVAASVYGSLKTPKTNLILSSFLLLLSSCWSV